MFRFLSLMFLGSAALSAAVSIETSMNSRFAQSEAVCRGKIVSVTASEQPLSRAGKMLPMDYQAQLAVDMCYKGAESAAGLLTVKFSQVDPMLGAPVAVRSQVLAFSNRVDSQSFAVAVPSGGILAFFPMDVESGFGTSGLGHLERDISALAKSSDSRTSKYALGLLLTFEGLSSDTRDDLIGKNPDLRNPTLDAPPELGRIGNILANESSLDDLGALEEISASPIPHLRRTAMLGIRRLKAPQSVPFLVNQLASGDRDVEYLAVITLAEITGKAAKFGPSMDLFEREPATYTALWTEWWRTEGIRLY